MTQRLQPADLAHAAELLRGGETVAFPTETVYGLGADATSDAAVARVFEAKARPVFNPLIVHLPDAAAAAGLVRMSDAASLLADAFWPGPMSLVMPLAPGHGLSSLVTAGLDTVALRVPAHPLARDLLREVGRPVAAPSANPSGKISPTTAEHVLEGLSGRIAAVLDGGPCAVGLESSIFGGDPLQLLRPGGVTAEQAEAVLGHALAPASLSAEAPNAPGQLTSHYAPEVGVVLDVAEPRAVPHLGFGPGAATRSLSEAGDLVEAAARLFALLREMDEITREGGFDHFTVAPIPKAGLGHAIRDRLTRAAAPRPST